MPRYLITKPLTAYLEVECSPEEISQWEATIVGTLEKNGVPVELQEKYGPLAFTCDYSPEDTMVEELEDETRKPKTKFFKQWNPIYM
jgi:hypothetical protein